MGTTIWAFLIFSVGIGVAAVLQVSQTLQVQADNFPELTMNVVAAVLVGGTAVTGGDGSPVKSVIGALFIATTTQIADGALYTVANAQLDAMGPDGLLANVTLTPSRILRTPLDP